MSASAPHGTAREWGPGAALLVSTQVHSCSPGFPGAPGERSLRWWSTGHTVGPQHMLTSSWDFRSTWDSKTVATSALKVQAWWGVRQQQRGRRATGPSGGSCVRQRGHQGAAAAQSGHPPRCHSWDRGGTPLALNPRPAAAGSQKHHRRLYI